MSRRGAHGHVLCRYFGWLADVASVSGVTVDVLAVGASAVNVPLVAPVVAKSGGVLSIHEGEDWSVSVAIAS